LGEKAIFSPLYVFGTFVKNKVGMAVLEPRANCICKRASTTQELGLRAEIVLHEEKE
jgi:hypothetical protein